MKFAVHIGQLCTSVLFLCLTVIHAKAMENSPDSTDQHHSYHIMIPSDCPGPVCTGYFGHVDISWNFHLPTKTTKLKEGDELRIKLNEFSHRHFSVQKVNNHYMAGYVFLDVTSSDFSSIGWVDGKECFCCNVGLYCACNCDTLDFCSCR